MRKEITICDNCGNAIPAKKPCEIEIVIHPIVAKELGLEIHRTYYRGRKVPFAYIDICSKKCLLGLIEKIKQKLLLETIP